MNRSITFLILFIFVFRIGYAIATPPDFAVPQSQDMPDKGGLVDRLVYAAAQTYGQHALGKIDSWVQKRTVMIGDSLEIRVLLKATADQYAANLLEESGGRIEGMYANSVYMLVPVNKIGWFEGRDEIAAVYLPSYAIPQEFISEGLDTMGVSAFHRRGYTGRGVKVAVLDGGFQDYMFFLGTELPSNTQLRYYGNNPFTSTHGTECAQIIHDVAPDAELWLIQVSTGLDFLTACDWIKNNGFDVVSVSLAYLNVGWLDGSSDLSKKVDELRNQGILWVNSAANYGKDHWSGYFADTDGDGAHNFTSTDEGNSILLVEGQSVSILLSWNDWPYATDDYDLRLYDLATSALVASSLRPQTGTQEPTEEFTYTATATGIYEIVISKYSATGNAKLQLLVPGIGSLQYSNASYSVQIPGDARGALTVGAVPWQNPSKIEGFSSCGPTEDSRIKPEMVAPDSVTVADYWTTSTVAVGTSFSCPHVAGAAAVYLSAKPTVYPPAVIDSFKTLCIDLGVTGTDNTYGWGLLHMRILNRTPSAFSLQYPANGATLSADTTSLIWNPASDPDVGDVIRYNLYYSKSEFSPLANAMRPTGLGGRYAPFESSSRDQPKGLPNISITNSRDIVGDTVFFNFDTSLEGWTFDIPADSVYVSYICPGTPCDLCLRTQATGTPFVLSWSNSSLGKTVKCVCHHHGFRYSDCDVEFWKKVIWKMLPPEWDGIKRVEARVYNESTSQVWARFAYWNAQDFVWKYVGDGAGWVSLAASAWTIVALDEPAQGEFSDLMGILINIGAYQNDGNVYIDWVRGYHSGTSASWDDSVMNISDPEYELTSLQRGASYRWSVVAEDLEGATSQCTIPFSFHVTVANRPPTLTNPGDKTVSENSMLAFALSATDLDGDALTYSANPLPAGAVFSNASGNFVWTPTYDQSGVYGVTFSVSDGQASDQQSIQIVVNNTNRPPSVFALLSPADDDTVKSVGALLRWSRSIDPDIGNTVTYNLFYSAGDTASWQHSVPSIADSQYTIASLEEMKRYYWKIAAQDNEGATAQCSRAFSFVAGDATPPSFTIDVLANPILPFELDLFFYPSESLSGLPEVTVAGPSGSGGQTVTQLSNRDAACYLTDYRIDQSGSYTITVCGTDLSTNRGCKDASVSASRLFVNFGAEVTSPLGTFRLRVAAGSSRSDGLVLCGERPADISDLVNTNIPSGITPVLIVDLKSTVAVANKSALLTIDPDVAGVSMNADQAIVLVPLSSTNQQPIPARLNITTGHYTAEITELCSYLIGATEQWRLEELPVVYELDQNTPNPFNGTTVIPFSTSEQVHVSLEVFNVLGQRVATLLDRDIMPGNYASSWDGKSENGSECSSGTYFYRLTAGSNMETKKMLYLK